MKQIPQIYLWCENDQKILKRKINKWLRKHEKFEIMNIAYSVQGSGMAHCCMMVKLK